MSAAYDKMTGASPEKGDGEGMVAGMSDMADEAPEAQRNAADGSDEPDEVTGASPGTAQACTDLGLSSLEANLSRFGINPPGVS